MTEDNLSYFSSVTPVICVSNKKLLDKYRQMLS